MKPTPLLIAAAIVSFTFFLVVMILWILKRIGGTPRSEVKAHIERFGGNLAITSVGLVGSFLAIAILAFVAFYFFTRLASP
jgi:heme/copper-type cytochrome/quinol oxidase subunit 2